MIDEDNSATLGHVAYSRLRDMILSGELPVGTTLQEKKLAEKLGVSRTPVREAIMRLMMEGLVLRSAGLTPVVRKLSLDDFIEILHVRRLLEVEAARKAAEVGDAGALDELLAVMKSYVAGHVPSTEEHVRSDDLLHEGIARLAGSRLLLGMIGDLRQKTRIFDKGRLPERFEPGAREHIEIIEAIKARDPGRAEAAMRTHIDNVRACVLTHLRRLF
ncbi:MAG: GntR family transcriptional regulator [Proteobacteria bacterium]|nr:GntR family transcriptional regulator [Pseudomonadota bacterium]